MYHLLLKLHFLKNGPLKIIKKGSSHTTDKAQHFMDGLVQTSFAVYEIETTKST